MAVRRRGKKWGYYFDAPGSTRANRITITGSGFKSKKDAQDAEAARRVEVGEEYEARARGVVGAVPHSLSQLLDEFCSQHADRNLGAKTAFRYRQQIAYLDPELLALRLADLTPLHFTREWSRLKDAGGHHRRTRQPRPLSSKTVWNIAAFVSSAFTYGMGQGIVQSNPVTASVKPRGGDQRPATALTPEQQDLLLTAPTHWILPKIMEVCAGLGARRGEVLALRWSDIQRGEVTITRTLCQVKSEVFFKDAPKTRAGFRTIAIPDSTLAVLDQARQEQTEFREYFGANYQDNDLVFCERDGRPLRPDSISAVASNIYRKLKLPRGSAPLHGLRHTHGSQLIANGVDIPTVSERLGHSNPATTLRIYAHTIKGRDAAAAKIWDAQRRPRPEATEETTDKPN